MCECPSALLCSLQVHTDYIKANNLPFSVATDASNKGRTKCFPIVLRYLYFEEGVQHALLDFYSDSNDTSEAITNQLLAKLEMSGLDVKYMSAYAFVQIHLDVKYMSAYAFIQIHLDVKYMSAYACIQIHLSVYYLLFM